MGGGAPLSVLVDGKPKVFKVPSAGFPNRATATRTCAA